MAPVSTSTQSESSRTLDQAAFISAAESKMHTARYQNISLCLPLSPPVWIPERLTFSTKSCKP